VNGYRRVCKVIELQKASCATYRYSGAYVCVNILGVVVCILVPEATRPDPIAEITQAIIVPSTLCVHTGHLLPVAPR
jgi:hypothetical protein